MEVGSVLRWMGTLDTPVLDSQSLDVLVVFGVVGNNGLLPCQRDGRDLEIKWITAFVLDVFCVASPS
jgi:hypothetical protein